MKKKTTYRTAGVDIAKAEKSLSQLKAEIEKTHNRNVLKPIGAFGGFYRFPAEDYREPVLVASTDGVGTKLKVAVQMNQHHTVGQDLVNHCIDDIAVCGAKPLFFLDYFACGQLNETVYRQIILGFARACREAGLPLIGGETAEMPDMYRPEDYDLAGTIVGVVDQEAIIDGRDIREGDVILGVASNGLHTNGYSLARKVLLNHFDIHDFIPQLNRVLGDELLRVHPNYYPIISRVRQEVTVKGLAHITGGGLIKNTRRILPAGLKPAFDWNSWPVPAIFQLIRDTGNVPEEDMRLTFNMGIGLVILVDPSDADAVLSLSGDVEIPFYPIGKIVKE